MKIAGYSESEARVRRVLTTVPGTVRSRLAEALVGKANEVARGALAAVSGGALHVRTQTLQKSIGVGFNLNSRMIYAKAGASREGFYGRMLETGVSKPVMVRPYLRVRKGKIEEVPGFARTIKIPAHPWLMPSFNRVRSTLEAAVDSAITQGLKDAENG